MTQQVLGSQDCPTVRKVPCNSSIFKKYHFLQTSTIHTTREAIIREHTIDVRTLIIKFWTDLALSSKVTAWPVRTDALSNCRKKMDIQNRTTLKFEYRSPLRKHGFVRLRHCVTIIYAMKCSVILLLFKKQVVCGHNRTDLRIDNLDCNRVLILLGWNSKLISVWLAKRFHNEMGDFRMRLWRLPRRVE